MAHRSLFHSDATLAPVELVFIKRVLIADSTTDTGYRNVDITLKDGLIAAVDEDGEGVCPPGAVMFDGFDRLLLPGAGKIPLPPSNFEQHCAAKDGPTDDARSLA